MHTRYLSDWTFSEMSHAAPSLLTAAGHWEGEVLFLTPCCWGRHVWTVFGGWEVCSQMFS